MSGTTTLQVLMLILVAAGGLAVVTQREPLNQAMASGAFGLLLAVLFLSFHAPDVALSQIVVGSFVIPTLVLVTIAKSGGGRR
jgi:energy-converting hydrogenase B subunit D